MENLTDLKSIWKNAATATIPESAEMITAIKKYRNKQVQKFTLMVILAFFSCGLMAFILFTFEHIKLLTITGGSLIIVASFIMILTNLNSLQRFYKLNACSNREYLAFLQKTQMRQRFFHTYTQPTVFLLTVLGILLFSFPKLTTNFTFTTINLLFLSIYFLVMWFYVRPLMYKKGSKKLGKQMEEAKRIAQQL